MHSNMYFHGLLYMYYVFCAVGRRLPCCMHVSLHRRSYKIVRSMYMYMYSIGMCDQRHYNQVLYVRESKLYNTPHCRISDVLG